MSDTFESALNDPDAPIALALVPGSRVLLVAFGGIVGQLGIPPFEFFALTQRSCTSRIFVRDLAQSWYHAGLRAYTSSLRGTAEMLQSLFARAAAERIVLIGNSMGAYAALAFGALLDVTEVHAFAAQTFIDREHRARFGDDRWPAQIERAHAIGDASLFDLLPLLNERTIRSRITVHYSPAEPLDRVHAERLAPCSRVQLCSYPTGAHNLVRELRDSGALAQIIASATAPPSR